MEDILKEVKQILKLDTDENDYKINYYIKTFQEKVKSICKRTDFPQSLDYMCIEFVRKSYLYYLNADEENNEKVEVSSTSDNGQSISFRSTEIITKSDTDVDRVISKNINEIKEYAYMEWR